MNEINYQVFDQDTGVPIKKYTDEKVRELAQKEGRSVSEVFEEISSGAKLLWEYSLEDGGDFYEYEKLCSYDEIEKIAKDKEWFSWRLSL